MDTKRVSLIEVDEKKFEDSVAEAEKVITDLSKELNKIGKILNKLKPMERFLVTDGLIGIVLNSAKLPTYLLGSITSKFWLFSQMPFLTGGKIQSNKTANYIG